MVAVLLWIGLGSGLLLDFPYQIHYSIFVKYEHVLEEDGEVKLWFTFVYRQKGPLPFITTQENGEECKDEMVPKNQLISMGKPHQYILSWQ